MDQLRRPIEAKIRALAIDYRNAPGTILTEDDLKCLLVSRFLEIPELRQSRETVDGIRGTMIHTEVSWFDENGQLRIKPDITILDPTKLSIFRAIRKGYPLPHKGFNFGGSSIIFELKFIRNKTGITKASVRELKKDVSKVARLFTRLANEHVENELFCYFVIFSKVAKWTPEFEQLIRNNPPFPRCRIIFSSAEVSWPSHT